MSDFPEYPKVRTVRSKGRYEHSTSFFVKRDNVVFERIIKLCSTSGNAEPRMENNVLTTTLFSRMQPKHWNPYNDQSKEPTKINPFKINQLMNEKCPFTGKIPEGNFYEP